MMRKTWLVCVAAAMPALMGCEGAEFGSATAELVIESAGPTGLRASLEVGDERIAIESKMAAVPGLGDGTTLVRENTIRGASGTTYADVAVDPESGENLGSFGALHFGGFDDADGDAIAWRAIATSQPGTAVLSVSSAAAVLVDRAGDASTKAVLESLVTMGGYLRELAGSDAYTAYQCVNGYTDVRCDDGGCVFSSSSTRTCAGQVCVRQYYANGNAVGPAHCSPALALSYSSWARNVCRYGRHWVRGNVARHHTHACSG